MCQYFERGHFICGKCHFSWTDLLFDGSMIRCPLCGTVHQSPIVLTEYAKSEAIRSRRLQNRRIMLFSLFFGVATAIAASFLAMFDNQTAGLFAIASVVAILIALAIRTLGLRDGI